MQRKPRRRPKLPTSAALAGPGANVMPGRLRPYVGTGLTGAAVSLGDTDPTPTSQQDQWTYIDESDFRRRRAGAVRWFDFNIEHYETYTINGVSTQINQLGIGGEYSLDRGQGRTEQAPSPWVDPVGFGIMYHRENDQPSPAPFVQFPPYLDVTQKASGSSSLCVPLKASYLGQSVSGEWWANASDDFSIHMEPNTSMYVQVKFRIDHTMATFPFEDTLGQLMANVKIFDFTSADDGVHWGVGTSSTALKIVNLHAPDKQQLFNSYGYYGPGSDVGYAPGNYLGGYQNGDIDTAYCRYAATPEELQSGITWSQCWKAVENEWATLQIGVTLGDYYVMQDADYGPGATIPPPGSVLRNVWRDSTIRIWATHENGPTQMILDWSPGVYGYRPIWCPDMTGLYRFGKVHLFNFMTSKSTTQQHPDAHTWYDELIISHQRIPDPAQTSNSGGEANTTIATIPAGSAMKIGTFACTSTGTGDEYRIIDYSSWHYDAIRNRFLIHGGGHSGTNYDALMAFYLGNGPNALTFVEEYAPLNRAYYYESNYDFVRGAWNPTTPNTPSSGTAWPHPAARHSYRNSLVLGDEFIQAAVVEGCQNGTLIAPWVVVDPIHPTASYATSTNGRIAHYDCTTRQWNFRAVSLGDFEASYLATCYDPESQLIVSIGQLKSNAYGGMLLYDPSASEDSTTSITDVPLTQWAEYWIRDPVTGNPPANGYSFGYSDALFYFPPDGCLYYFQRANGTVLRIILHRSSTPKDRAAASWSDSQCQQLHWGEFSNGPEAMAYDPVRQVFFGLHPDTHFGWTFNPLTGTLLPDGRRAGTWTQHSINSLGTSYTYPPNIYPLAWAANDGVFVWFAYDGVWAYRPDY